MPWLTLIRTLVFIEAYALVSTGLLASRSLVAYAGSGSDIAAILATGLLLPFALGLLWGARIVRNAPPVRRLMLRSLTLALLFIALGQSIFIMDAVFMGLSVSGVDLRLLTLTIYTLVFLAPPALLMGRNVPLLARLAGRHAMSLPPVAAAGALAGLLVSKLVLMPWLGVHVALLVVALLLGVAIALLLRAVTVRSFAIPALILLLCLALNSGYLMRAVGIYYQNAENTLRVTTLENSLKVLRLNGAPAAYYNERNGQTDPALETAEKILLEPIAGKEPKREILVLGAGGFTFGLKDELHYYTYVDIDPDLKKAVEDYFLGRKLGSNKKFVPESARSFLAREIRTGHRYDLVYIDLYNGEMWMPEDVVTQDFFDQVRKVLKPGGIAAANIMASPALTNDYSLSIDATWRSVFPAMTRNASSTFSAWETDPRAMMNFLYLGFNRPLTEHGTIYTDERNPSALHKPAGRVF